MEWAGPRKAPLAGAMVGDLTPLSDPSTQCSVCCCCDRKAWRSVFNKQFRFWNIVNGNGTIFTKGFIVHDFDHVTVPQPRIDPPTQKERCAMFGSKVRLPGVLVLYQTNCPKQHLSPCNFSFVRASHSFLPGLNGAGLSNDMVRHAAALLLFTDVALQGGIVGPPVWQACLWDETDFVGRSCELSCCIHFYGPKAHELTELFNMHLCVSPAHRVGKANA